MPALAKLAKATAIGVPLLAIAGAAATEQLLGGVDTAYTAKAMSAAPQSVSYGATIVRVINGTMQTVRRGTNEYTCMVASMGPMCLAPIATRWAHAWQTRTPPPDELGYIYMLAGTTGMSNTDPWAAKPTGTNHWVWTGPHIMMVGSPVAKMNFPRTLDPDPTKPFIMWAGTPYEHVMIPMSRDYSPLAMGK